MTKNLHLCFSFLLIFAVLFCAGCKDNMGETYPLTVKVTLDGTPLEGATVMLLEPTQSKTAVGTTDASGVATVKSTEGWDGVFPGEYGVTIMKTEHTTTTVPPKGEDVSPDEDGNYAVSIELLPSKYASTKTSGLTLKQENKKGSFQFDISENP